MTDSFVKPNFADEELEKFSKEDLLHVLKQFKGYTSYLEEKEKKNLFELGKLKNIILMNYVSSKELESTVNIRVLNQSTFLNYSKTIFFNKNKKRVNFKNLHQRQQYQQTRFKQAK